MSRLIVLEQHLVGRCWEFVEAFSGGVANVAHGLRVKRRSQCIIVGAVSACARAADATEYERNDDQYYEDKNDPSPGVVRHRHGANLELARSLSRALHATPDAVPGSSAHCVASVIDNGQSVAVSPISSAPLRRA